MTAKKVAKKAPAKPEAAAPAVSPGLGIKDKFVGGSK